LPPLPVGTAELDRLFETVAVSIARKAVPEERKDEHLGPDFLDDLFSFHYDQKTGKPRIATQGFVNALKMLQRLQECRPAEPDGNPMAAFRDGQAVLAIADAPALLDVQRALRDKVGICVVPGSDYYYTPRGQKVLKQDVNRTPYLGGAGWLAAVPADAANPEAAFDLLADLCGPLRSTQIVLEPRWGGGPIRTNQVLRERWDAFDLDAARSLALKDTLTRTLLHGLLNPVLCPRTPDAIVQRAILAKQLRRALVKQVNPVDASDALKAVEKEWEQLNAKKGEDVQRREYRMSLGLRD
jgi:multiple sugar transport system substrate-binding protein